MHAEPLAAMAKDLLAPVRGSAATTCRRTLAAHTSYCHQRGAYALAQGLSFRWAYLLAASMHERYAAIIGGILGVHRPGVRTNLPAHPAFSFPPFHPFTPLPQ